MESKITNLKAENTAPAEGAISVTPNDSNDLTYLARSLFVGTSGNIAVNMADGSSVTFANVQSGQFLPIRVKRILATGTTATNILALY